MAMLEKVMSGSGSCTPTHTHSNTHTHAHRNTEKRDTDKGICKLVVAALQVQKKTEKEESFESHPLQVVKCSMPR